MTRAEALKLSWELWDLVAKLPEKELLSSKAKVYAMEIMGYHDEQIEGNCFACEYAKDEYDVNCTRCPVPGWSNHSTGMAPPCIIGEYGRFTLAKGESEHRRLALVIRDLMHDLPKS